MDGAMATSSTGTRASMPFAAAGARRPYVRKLSSESSGSVDSSMLEEGKDKQTGPRRDPVKDRRIIEAEKILGEIAKEYAAKRAAGLVPTKPVPARTLLWEEMARNARTQVAKRGQCVFGRDTGEICGCSTYRKLRVGNQENPGGVCECCNHGAAWHRLTGGANLRSSRFTRSIAGSSVRQSRVESMLASEARSSMYDYDSDMDDDDDDLDDEDIANEVARPYGYTDSTPAGPPPAGLALPSPLGIYNERISQFSNSSSFGFPSRLSSGANSLGALLQAIQRYREEGLSEDDIEIRIREEFPPVPRRSSIARSDVSGYNNL
ncbi:hypothetical protein P43SY_004497 [Pythium insidiosum]|uniref:Uncharacterized protein n=1 Tax=Pythium insidiosum TaxID=114742 RepID=A0AAD5Q6D3_PYTIN|nr:hypothetical protein P43SY_004497 [Pythium insidiosum]